MPKPCPIRGDTSAKAAFLVLQLSADSGYRCTVSTRVSADQWSEICAITDRPDLLTSNSQTFVPSPGSWFSYSTNPTIYRCLFIDHCTILYENDEGDRYMGSSTETFVPVQEPGARVRYEPFHHTPSDDDDQQEEGWYIRTIGPNSENLNEGPFTHVGVDARVRSLNGDAERLRNTTSTSSWPKSWRR